jgi:hypothetical protein
VDGPGSRLCPVAGLNVDGVEPSVSLDVRISVTHFA